MEDKEYIELAEHRAMLYLPENAVEICIIAKVYQDDKLQEAKATYDLKEIRDAFADADNNYIDDDDRYVITPKGKAFLEEYSDNIN